MIHKWGKCFALATACLFAGPLAAQDEPEEPQSEGQAQLDQAIDAKLEAESFDDLGRVIALCESALKTGLEDENEALAKRLLASTLLQRASFVYDSLIDIERPDEQWIGRLRQLRPVAVTDLKKALEYDFSEPQAHYMLGRLLALPGGDRQGAIEALSGAIKHSGDNDDLKAEALAARASVQTDADAKRADFDAAIKITGNDADVLLSRARFLIQQGKAEEALADCDRAAELEPDAPDSYQVRAAAQVALERLDDAVASLGEVLARDDRQWSAYVQRARLYAAKSDGKRALADLDQALEIEPRAAQALLFRADLRQQSGDLEGALADSQRLVAVAPQSVRAVRMHAVILARAGKLDQAIGHLERTRQSNEKDAALALHLAMLYVADRQPEQAIDAYTDVLAMENKSWIAHQGRADAALMLGRQGDALADYEQALALEPGSDSTLNNLAWLLATSTEDELRDGVRALQLATEACRVTEYQKPHILSTLAAAYAELGDFDTAIEWLTHALELEDGGVRDALEKELASYRDGKPWRENQALDGEPAADSDEPADAAEPGDDQSAQDEP